MSSRSNSDDETNPLVIMMTTPLPPIQYQKKKLYRPSEEVVFDTFSLLNEHIFDNKLPVPPIQVKQLQKKFGQCTGYVESSRKQHHAVLELVNRFHCVQWMVMILAHEMAHQYQWDVDGIARIEANKRPLLSHGPSFFKFGQKMKEYGIPLRVKYCSDLWLRTQANF